MGIISKKKYSLVSIFALALLVSLAIFSKQVIAAPPDVPPGLLKAMEVQDRHTPNIMSNPDVVGTGIGLNSIGKPIIHVFTVEEGVREIPSSLEGFPVKVIVTGEIFALAQPSNKCDKDEDGFEKDNPKCGGPDCNDNNFNIKPGADEICDGIDNNCDGAVDEGGVCAGGPTPTPDPTPTPTPDPSPPPTSCNDTTDRCRPAYPGSSTGHPAITAGTIGCRVIDASENVYALSNNHVYADINSATLGDAVIQPGTFDGGSLPNDDIGTLADFEPIFFGGVLNEIDAAIALTTEELVGNSTLNCYGVPKSNPLPLNQINFNMKVQKCGRTTGLTQGRVSYLNVTVNVNYGVGVATFINQIGIRPGGFSAGGDSGSLIVVKGGNNDRRPVGLLYAGSSSLTIANPIIPILTRFDVTIDGE